ncbi:hypothetical protein PR048_018172 [Dryococelus australis]|uniref:Uncharacterized protein n=1 Tax=Dryococelus australis TaxID=614101 RepID=A0ABQ9HBJ2_9NEOP|nr:hypothetical protein PR048_018172 [Dryococelus australis]
MKARLESCVIGTLVKYLREVLTLTWCSGFQELRRSALVDQELPPRTLSTHEWLCNSARKVYTCTVRRHGVFTDTVAEIDVVQQLSIRADLSPLDFLFWGCLNSRAYSGRRSDTRDQLPQTITDATNKLRNKHADMEWQHAATEDDLPGWSSMGVQWRGIREHLFETLQIEAKPTTSPTCRNPGLCRRKSNPCHRGVGLILYPHSAAAPGAVKSDVTVIAGWLVYSPPTTVNWARFPARSPPDFRNWESCRTMPLVGGFSQGSPASPNPFILTLLHPPIASPTSALNTSMLTVTQISSLTHFESKARAMEIFADYFCLFCHETSEVLYYTLDKERPERRRKAEEIRNTSTQTDTGGGGEGGGGRDGAEWFWKSWQYPCNISIWVADKRPPGPIGEKGGRMYPPPPGGWHSELQTTACSSRDCTASTACR